MYVLPGDVGVLLFLDRKKTSPRILRQTCYEISKSNAYWCFIADLGFGEWIQNHASWLSTQIPLTSRTSYIKNAIRKTFCFFKMVYSIFDRISDALITTYLTQLVLINCVCVIRYFSKKKQFESSILAKSKSFLFLYFDSSTPTSTQNCFFRNPKCSDSLQSIPMIVCISRYSFSSNWNCFKRFHSLCLCSEECLINWWCMSQWARLGTSKIFIVPTV